MRVRTRRVSAAGNSTETTWSMAARAWARSRGWDVAMRTACGCSSIRARILWRSPDAMAFPLWMRTMLFVTRSTSYRTWVDMITWPPRFAKSVIARRIWTRAMGSAPESGSSRMSRSGPWARAWASLARCRMPRLYVRVGRSFAPVRPTNARLSSAAFRAAPASIPLSRRSVSTNACPVIQP